MPRTSAITPEKFATFGELLRFLRRKAELTQRELAIAVGYSESQISRLEKNERAPDESMLAARFVPALYIEEEQQWVSRLLELGAATHSVTPEADAPQPIADAKPIPHNLPIQLTSFIGREKEISELTKLFSGMEEGVRLITLTGHGGSGKTRLALQVALGLLERFPDGVWLVEFASLSDPALVPQEVAVVLGLKEEPGRTIIATLASHLAEKQVLLILDNCEHLVQASASLVASLLLACPNLHVLATSREMLGVAGEQAFYVPSLTLPETQVSLSVDVALQSEAIKLFVERSKAVAPKFILTEENVSAVVQVCRQLDGIPLAIELATARLKLMPVQQIADHIDDAFRLLTGGIRTAMPRHQTLQALMDWSYNLLTGSEKTLFRRLAVFAGGWTMEAAERVGVGEDIEASDVFDLLAHLVDKSLMQVEELGNVARYRFLETVRQYAMAKLAESGEADIVRRRHAEYYVSLDEDAFIAKPAWYSEMELEYDNLLAALSWSKSVRGEWELRFRLTQLFSMYSYWHGSWNESRKWLEDAIGHPEAINFPREQAELYSGLAQVLSMQGDYEASEKHHTRVLSYAREVSDRPGIAWELHWLGHNAREHDDATAARARLEESVAIFQELGEEATIAMARNTLAEAAILQGDTGLAKSMLEENLALARKVEVVFTIGWSLNHLGHVAQLEGDFEKAIQLHEESLPLFQQVGSQNEGTIWAHQSLGETLLAQGKVSLAVAHFTEALTICQDLGERAGLAWCLAGLAGVAALNEEPERAAWLWGAAEALRKSIGAREAPASHATHERLKAEVRQQLGEETFNAKWAEGEAASVDEVIDEAML